MEMLYLRSQRLEHFSIGEYWNTFGVLSITGKYIYHPEADNNWNVEV